MKYKLLFRSSIYFFLISTFLIFPKAYSEKYRCKNEYYTNGKIYNKPSEFVLERSKKISTTVAISDLNESIAKLYKKILSRYPSPEELSKSISYIGLNLETQQERWQRLAQNLLISNEFIFRD